MAAIAPAPAVEPAAAALPRRLRVGLFADASQQPRWVIEAFAKLAASAFAEVTAIGCGGGAAAAAPLAWRCYDALDRRAFRVAPEERLDLAAHVPHRKRVDARHEDLAALGLDVAFALGGFDERLLEGVARHGVWRFWFGPQRGDAEPLAGCREVAQGAPLTGAGLKVRLAPGAPLRLAYQSWSRTYPFSVARNRHNLLRKAAEFPWRALRELHGAGRAWLEQCPAATQPAAPAPLGAPELVSGLRRIGGAILHRGLEKALHVDQWFLAFRFGGGRAESGGILPDLRGFTRIVPPRDRYWADPFALEKNGRYYVFFEELPFAAGKAHISMIEIRRDGSWSAPVRVLERDYHLSYPFLQEQDGELYMIPETAKNETVEVWRCVEFPLRWRLERVLLQGVRLVDATFHRGEDRWWMFANGAAGGGFDDELHLFHAERLLGDWQPHRRNPVKSDVRCARPAGRLYRRGGGLYRPAQVCVPLYGAGLSINRVLRLTPQEYAERQVERILPAAQAGLFGLHTVNRAGELTVVDAFMRKRRI